MKSTNKRRGLGALSAFILAAGLLVTAAPADAAIIGVNPDRTRFRPEFELSESRVKRLQFDLAINKEVGTEHDGVDYYIIKYGKNEKLPNPNVLRVDGDVSQVDVLRLKSGRKYYFEVTGYFNDGKFSKTLKQEAWTKQNRPRFLKIKKKTYRSARLKWKKPYRSPWYTRHEVRWYKVNPNKNGSQQNEKIGQEYIYTASNYYLDVSNLEADTKYYYQVRARIFSKDWGKWSDKKFFRTKKAPAEM